MKTTTNASKVSGRPKNEPGGRWDHDAFRIVRAVTNVTQHALSVAVGVSPATISRWEAGVNTPPQSMIGVLAYALEVKPAAFGSMAAATRQSNRVAR